jgi:hypothetical protein
MNYLLYKNWQSDETQTLLNKVAQVLLLLIIVSIPFSIRYVISSTWNFQLGVYSDFTSLSIYISDFLILGFIATVLFIKMVDKPVSKLWKIGGLVLVGWLILELVIHKFNLPEVYYTFRLIGLLLFSYSISKIDVPREKIAWLFAILGSVQGLIALTQFSFQNSLGLKWIGESILSIDTVGVAKIVSDGLTLIRGYGTFPHANILAGFLVISTLLNIYLLNKSSQHKSTDSKLKPSEILLYIMLFINTFGLFISFSRGGILALGVAIFFILSKLALNKQYIPLRKIIVSCGTAFAISIAILFPFLSSRVTVSDQASHERTLYNSIGVELIKNNPVMGQGLGQSLLHMKQIADTSFGVVLNPWEIQPIHNYWLISAADLGIGSIILLVLLMIPVIGLFKSLSETRDYWKLTLASIWVGFLCLFMIDHYFYTVWSTEVLLWVLVGIALSTVPREANPNIQKVT